MSNEIQELCIGELVEEIIDRRGVTPLKLGSEFMSEGYRVISAKLIKNSQVDLSVDEPRFVDKKTYKKWMHSPLLEGDVILTSEAPLGECAYIKEIHEWCLGQRLFGIRPNRNILAGRYLFYALRSREIQQQLQSRASGTTVQGIRQTELLKVRIPVPPLAEQRAIAHILGTLDDKIELNRKMNETLEAMARALFKSWFVDFAPVRAKAEGRDTGLPKDIADLFPDEFEDSELGEIPKGWRVVSAGRLFGINIGKTPPRKESRWFSESREDIPWISIKDLGGCGAFIQKTSEYLTKEAVERFRIRLIPEGTVVVSFKLTLGRVAITDGVMLSNEAIAHFLPYPETKLTSNFLFCYLKQFNFDSLGNTSSIATAVNSESIRSLPLLIPEERQVLRFSSGVASMFFKMKCLQGENVELVELRDVLLPKLLSGELRVSEAEKIVEAAS